MRAQLSMLAACGEQVGRAVSLRAEDANISRDELQLPAQAASGNNTEDEVIQMDSMSTVIEHCRAVDQIEEALTAEKNKSEQKEKLPVSTKKLGNVVPLRIADENSTEHASLAQARHELLAQSLADELLAQAMEASIEDAEQPKAGNANETVAALDAKIKELEKAQKQGNNILVDMIQSEIEQMANLIDDAEQPKAGNANETVAALDAKIKELEKAQNQGNNILVDTIQREIEQMTNLIDTNATHSERLRDEQVGVSVTENVDDQNVETTDVLEFSIGSTIAFRNMIDDTLPWSLLNGLEGRITKIRDEHMIILLQESQLESLQISHVEFFVHLNELGFLVGVRPDQIKLVCLPEPVEKTKIQSVLSKVECDRSTAINALLSMGSDVEAAVELLHSVFQEDIVESTNDVICGSSSSTHTDQNQALDEILTESSCEPIAMALPSGRVWGKPETYSVCSASISIDNSSIPFGVASQAGHDAHSGTVSLKAAAFNELVLACKIGDLPLLKKLLKNIMERWSIDINQTTSAGEKGITQQRAHGSDSREGITPLIAACQGDALSIVKELINVHGADVHARSTSGAAPLHFASAAGHRTVVKALIQDFSARVDDRDDGGRTPLHKAAEAGNLDIIKTLIQDFNSQSLDAKNKHGEAPLHLASFTGNLVVVKALIHDFKSQSLDAKTINVETPLHYAVRGIHFKVVKALLDDFNVPSGTTRNNDDNNSSQQTFQENNQEAAQALMQDFIAEVNTETHTGGSLLHSAAEYGYLELLKALLQVFNDGSVDEKNQYIKTFSKKSLLKGNLDIVKALTQDFSAVVDLKDREGCTPLHKASEAGNLEIIKALLLNFNSQSVDAKTSNGDTPLHKASMSGHLEIVKVLIQDFNSQSVDAKNDNGSTPLHLASAEGHLATVKALIQDFNSQSAEARNKNGSTPLHLAAEEVHLEVVKALLPHAASDLPLSAGEPVEIVGQFIFLQIVFAQSFMQLKFI